eukprot:jgi/Psemu1/263512/estExt_Genewise1Plus.C_10510016
MNEPIPSLATKTPITSKIKVNTNKNTNKNTNTNLPSVPVARLTGHDGPVQAITFTSDGKWCLTGGLDRTVKLWNPFREPTSIAFHNLPPALNIQTYSGGLTHEVSALCVTTTSSSSQTLLAASHQTLVVTDLVTNQVKRRLGQNHHTGRINAVAATQHGGDAYLTGSYDATVAIWDGRSRDTKPLQVLSDAKDSVTTVCVRQHTHDGDYNNNNNNNTNTAVIRTASVDGILRTYDLRKGILQCDDFGSPITSVAHTRDGNCLAVSCLDGTIRLVDAGTGTDTGTGELLNTYASHHTAGRYGLDVDILADDATIVTGSENGACALYDLVRADAVQILEGPARRPTCTVKAHPKRSSLVIAASYDNSTVVWSHDPAPWQDQLASP